MKWNLKEDTITVLVMAFLTLFVVWIVVTQPTFTAQSSQDKPLHISAENLKKHVYTIVEKLALQHLPCHSKPLNPSIH